MGDEKSYCLIYRELCEWAQDSHCDQQNYCIKREAKIREEDSESRDDETSELDGFENSALMDEEDEG